MDPQRGEADQDQQLSHSLQKKQNKEGEGALQVGRQSSPGMVGKATQEWLSMQV